MLKFAKYFLFLFISQLIISCQTTTIEKNNVKTSKNEDKTIVKPFVLQWELEKNHMTKLPKESKIEAQKYCQNRRLVLIKLDTNEALQAIGTFICGKKLY